VRFVGATRDPVLTTRSLFFRAFDDVTEAAIMTVHAVGEGAMNTARREIRYLLERTVQALYVDERMSPAPFDQRLEFLRSKRVAATGVQRVKNLGLDMLAEPTRDAFRKRVIDAWSDASAYAHPTLRQIQERLELRESGVTIGFESVDVLAGTVDRIVVAFEIVAVLALHAVPRSLAGDLVEFLAEDWTFRGSRFVVEIDAAFDYKAEREDQLASITERRRDRLARGM
jgi:hypothetical protein